MDFARFPALRVPTVTVERSSLFADRGLALRSIIGFWAFYVGTVLVRALLGPEAASAMSFRLISAAIGVALTGLIYLLLRLFARDAGIARMATIAALLALPAAVTLSFASLQMSLNDEPMGPTEHMRTQEGIAIVQSGRNIQLTQSDGKRINVTLPPIREQIGKKFPTLVGDGTVTWYFLLATWCAIYISLTQQTRNRLTERRLAEAESAAHAAQVRALRYQVNPHFLFNTLNSLSALVMSGRTESAEEMLLALSAFFRTSLSLDPSADVTLAEEIALQQQYLAIERARFPDRLEVVIDVPDDLAQMRVPALLLQPLVENAIKYGVSATRNMVRLTIAARRLDGGRMELEVTNTLAGSSRKATAQPAHEGTGLGLANVCQRLAAHYGNRADCRFGPIAGGYRVSMALPIDSDD